MASKLEITIEKALRELPDHIGYVKITKDLKYNVVRDYTSRKRFFFEMISSGHVRGKIDLSEDIIYDDVLNMDFMELLNFIVDGDARKYLSDYGIEKLDSSHVSNVEVKGRDYLNEQIVWLFKVGTVEFNFSNSGEITYGYDLYSTPKGVLIVVERELSSPYSSMGLFSDEIVRVLDVIDVVTEGDDVCIVTGHESLIRKTTYRLSKETAGKLFNLLRKL